MPLADFDSRFGGRDLVTHAIRNPSSTGDARLPQPGFALGVNVVARVDHGRWIADCPNAGCTGAEYVSVSGRQGFFCTECRNAAAGHLSIAVVLPEQAMREQIDAYLSARPVPANRNWRPGETVKDLQRENRERGVRLQ